jgi:rubrerythrin
MSTANMTTTYETGGTSKPLDAVAVLPERTVDFAGMEDVLGGLNARFVADFLSEALMHEQCGRHLYRAAAAQTNNPMLKRRFEQYGAETEEHVVVLQNLIRDLGGDPGYVSPSARATEKMDTGMVEATFAIDGSIDLMTKELVLVNAVVLAETIDHANWEMLAQLHDEVPEGPARDAIRAAVDHVRPQEDDHVMWAVQTRKRLIAMQATSPVVAGVAATAEELVERMSSWFEGDGS